MATKQSASIRLGLMRLEIMKGAGGAIVFHMGWGRHFGSDRRRYYSGEAGLSLDDVRLLVDNSAAIVGADNHAFEPLPTGPAGLADPARDTKSSS